MKRPKLSDADKDKLRDHLEKILDQDRGFVLMSCHQESEDAPHDMSRTIIKCNLIEI